MKQVIFELDDFQFKVLEAAAEYEKLSVTQLVKRDMLSLLSSVSGIFETVLQQNYEDIADAGPK